MSHYYWFKFPVGFFETPLCLSVFRREKGKRLYLFYIFLLCHAVKNRGYLSLENNKAMPLQTISRLYCKPLFTIMRYCKALEKIGLVIKTKKGYYLPSAVSLIGLSKNDERDADGKRRKEEEEKEIEIDKYLEKREEKETEKAKAKESKKTPYGRNFDPETVFADVVSRFHAEADKWGGESP